ncbi:hypothetical protein LTR98_009221 [Exophiala xenobiotica]|nr:hypothetical protein LTR98_009221 [Exophiala xenobiotica]
MATSQVFFFQHLGGMIFLALAETIFTSGLRSALHHVVPDVDAETVIDAGASAIRSVVTKADLPGVLQAYNHAIVDTFYLAVGGTCAAFFVCFGLGWQKLPQKETGKKDKVEGLERTASNVA